MLHSGALDQARFVRRTLSRINDDPANYVPMWKQNPSAFLIESASPRLAAPCYLLLVSSLPAAPCSLLTAHCCARPTACCSLFGVADARKEPPVTSVSVTLDKPKTFDVAAGFRGAGFVQVTVQPGTPVRWPLPTDEQAR